MTSRNRSYAAFAFLAVVVAALLVVQAIMPKAVPVPTGAHDWAPTATGPSPTTAPGVSPATAPNVSRRAHVFVTGRVQGVGFRDFTQMNAQKLKLTGWVRNLNDGRVEAVIEGPDGDVATLLDHIRQGPPGSRVEKVEVQDEKFTGEFEHFVVNR